MIEVGSTTLAEALYMDFSLPPNAAGAHVYRGWFLPHLPRVRLGTSNRSAPLESLELHGGGQCIAILELGGGCRDSDNQKAFKGLQRQGRDHRLRCRCRLERLHRARR